MPALNFKEISEAHIASGQQDKWEQFAEEFLPRLGFRIVEGPSRGVDEGKDLIVVGRDPDDSSREIRWLVSCKHKAHSGKSVGLKDEQDILDRVISHDCQGFIGFYSRTASSGVKKKLQGLSTRIRTRVIHDEEIEAELLRNGGDLTLAKRYFPKSMDGWQQGIVGIADEEKAAIAYKYHNGTFTLLFDENGLTIEGQALAFLLERARLMQRFEEPVHVDVASTRVKELSKQARALKSVDDSSLDMHRKRICIDRDILEDKRRAESIRIACEQVFIPSVLMNSLYMIGLNYNARARMLIRAVELICTNPWPERYDGAAYIEVYSPNRSAAGLSAKFEITEEQVEYLVSQSFGTELDHLRLPGVAEASHLPTDVVIEEVVPRVLAKYANEKSTKRGRDSVKEEWLNVGDWYVGLG